MSSKYRRDSFLKNAELYSPIFLGMNNLPVISADTSDESYVIQPAYEERPDLLAYKLYGTSRLWWVFARRNPDELLDPIRDFISGKVIMLPTSTRINSIVSI